MAENNRKYSKHDTSTSYQFNNDSSEEDPDTYQKILEYSMAELKNRNSAIEETSNGSDKSDEGMGPTEMRIEFIKNLIDDNQLQPMIDIDAPDTETAVTARLNKKIMDVKQLFASMNVKLKYIKSGTTGHTFKAISKTDRNKAFAVKVCAYPIDDDYGAMNNIARPENAELQMLKVLSSLVVSGKSPHFVLPILCCNTSITPFINGTRGTIDFDDKKNEMYKKFIERYNKGEFENFVSVLVSEWCNGGDLLDYIRNNFQDMTLRQWKVIIFQILYTLALIHEKYPNFKHNDMKANNILVQITNLQTNYYFSYNLDNYQFLIPNVNISVKIWDFDFSCIDGLVNNNKVNSDWTNEMNITCKKNRYYDMHYFFNTLINKRFFPQFYEGGVPQEIVDFIHRVIPPEYRIGSKYVNKKGRLQVDVEYTTPYKIIMTDPLFDKYKHRRKKDNNSSNKRHNNKH